MPGIRQSIATASNGPFVERFERRRAVGCDARATAAALERAKDDDLVDRIVLGYEHERRLQARLEREGTRRRRTPVPLEARRRCSGGGGERARMPACARAPWRRPGEQPPAKLER